nr:BTB domain containing protein [Pandoravirus aubagnensis]
MTCSVSASIADASVACTMAQAFPVDLRHVGCDCMIRLRSASAPDDAPYIMAHRAVLSRAGYFASLFRHTKPDSIYQGTGAGGWTFYAVYTIEAPFGVPVIQFLIDCLYASQALGRANAADPITDAIDVAGACYFLQMPTPYTDVFVETAIDTVAKHAPPAPTVVLARLCVLVRCMLDAGVYRDDNRRTLFNRVIAVLSPRDADFFGRLYFCT